jgi:type II secretory pathway pseudopilin PulG
VTIGIIGLLATIVFFSLGKTTAKARDTKRKADLSQIGRFIQASSCYIPDAGPGEYDLAVLLDEIKTSNPQAANFITRAPQDPKSGSAAQTQYRYILSEDRQHCALYANLENPNEPVTLTGIDAPTAGGGSGVLRAVTPGWNGSNKYYQIGK